MLKLLSLFAVLFFLIQPMSFSEEEGDLPNLGMMGPDIYRGGQPTEKGYDMLREKGVKTVINFRHENEWISRGFIETKKRGMQQISLPWTIFGSVEKTLADEFLSALENAPKPVYVHCRRGVERTGVMHVLYEMKVKGKSEDEAKKKALEPYPVKWIWKPFVRSKLELFTKED